MNRSAFYGWTCCALSQVSLLILANGHAIATTLSALLLAMSAVSAALALVKKSA